MSNLRKIFFPLALVLLAFGLFGLITISDRGMAALFDAWKFSESPRKHGIDLGANSSLNFLSLSMLGMAACIPIVIASLRSGDKLLYRIATAAIGTYFLSNAILFTLISSGLAYFYCGR